MRAARFLFTTIAFVALTPGLGFAGEPSTQPSGQDPSGNQATSDRPADHVRGNGVQTDAKYFKNDNRDPGKGRQARPITSALPTILKANNNREQPLRPPVVSGTTALSPGVVHRQAATAASIGGSAISSAKNSAKVINGTLMKHKP